MKRQSKAEKIADKRIDRAYRATCCNIEINIMDIPKIFRFGREVIATGADDATLAEKIRAFVDTIRVPA